MTNTFDDDQPIPIVILAGGKSQRLQVNEQLKWQLPFINGHDLMSHIISKAQRQSSIVIINGPQDTSSPLYEYGLPVIEDTQPNTQGPLAGLLTSMQWAQSNHYPWVATIACDTPFFPDDLIVQFQLSLTQTDKQATMASSQQRIHGVFGLWSSQLLNQLNHDFCNNGARSIQRWATPHASITHFSSSTKEGLDSFVNINSLEDYQRVLSILEQ